MKIRLLLILSVCIAGITHAQVGINTEDPQGILHVKGTQSDVVVKEGTGNVGIGTTNPVEKLHVVGNTNISGNSSSNNTVVTKDTYVEEKTSLGGTLSASSPKLEIISSNVTSGMRLEGSTELAGKIFVSDASGVGSLRNLKSEFKLVEGVIAPSKTVSVTSGTTFTDISDTPLSLTKGRWLILAKAVIYQPTNTTGAQQLTARMAQMRLMEDGSTINEVGVMAQQRGYRIATPEIIHIVHIPSGTREYTLSAYILTENNTLSETTASSRRCRTANDTRFGNQYFKAVRLDDE